MPPLNWDIFARLSGSAQSNFEMLCRILVRKNYGRYGEFAALAAQPGVEFHLKLHTQCSLGSPGEWFGWQSRWYDLPSGRALGNARRYKIQKALETTKKVLPRLTDWVLWTRHTLTRGDQKWFFGLKTGMRLHLWTATEIEEQLSGEAEIFRSTYFGELVLTSHSLDSLHQKSVAPIRQRWLPEVHQAVDAERILRQVLGEYESWVHLKSLANQLNQDARSISDDTDESNKFPQDIKKLVRLSLAHAGSLSNVYAALVKGDLDLLWEELRNRPAVPSPDLNTLPRQLRARRQVAALSVTNAIADIRYAYDVLDDVGSELGKKLVCVLAEVGCGKTQLAAQLTAATPDRPSGVFLHGRSLHANQNLDHLAQTVVIHGNAVPTMEALIAALDAAGQRAHRRLPIVIDGLNEAEDARTWKPLLAELNETLKSYPYVLVVCTIRTTFASEAIPQGVEQLNIPDFGHDSIQAIRKYFKHYRINSTDAELPIGLLRNPLTLRLFCEVSNPTREHVVGIEAMPKSLTALFERYLEQAVARVAELSPRTHRYFDQDIRSALNKVGSLLWEEGARSLDLVSLRNSLNDSGPWNESIVGALEHEGLLLRFPSKPPDGPTMAIIYDALAGHLVANAILTKYGQTGFEAWSKDSAAVSMLDPASPAQHPLAQDTFRALVGLVPRRFQSQQLWTMIDPSLRDAALRAAADLEGTYLDSATVGELSKFVQAPTSGRDLLDRLWQTRGAPNHPLNSEFLDSALRVMKLPDRDLRWTEWIRRHQEELIADVQRLEQRWRLSAMGSPAERLRARWIMWLLSSTVRELRDQATRTLYWFGRHDLVGLFRLTLDALNINDPYISERMLAAAYGVCMAVHCRPKREQFRAKLLPSFGRCLYSEMFAGSAPHSTTHALARDYARRIIDLARLHKPSILKQAERGRVVPPFQDGGIRDWQSMEDPNKGKYREGNAPLGMDFENYTIGGLVANRRNYDFKNAAYTQVVGQITWRIYQLGYSLEAFGEIDKAIAGQRYFGRTERPTVERYGKKYARIAYFELYGFRKDEGLLEPTFHEPTDRPPDADIDPSFPERPRKTRLVQDFLGDRSVNVSTWVKNGPVPAFQEYLRQSAVAGVSGPWILLDAHCSQEDKNAERVGFVFIQAFLMLRQDVEEFICLLKKEPPRGRWLPEAGEEHYTFAGEIPWSETFPYSELSTVTFVVAKTKVKVSPTDPRYNIRVIFDIGGTKRTIEPRKPPEFEEVEQFKRIGVYVPVRRSSFSSNEGIERPSCVVPTKELAKYFRLWLNLPAWDMYNDSGKQCTIVTDGGGFADHERHFFLRQELVDDLLSSQELALLWVVWGERQHFVSWRAMTNAPSAGYKYFRQIYRYTRRGQIQRVS